jgi:hypothetical protein
VKVTDSENSKSCIDYHCKKNYGRCLRKKILRREEKENEGIKRLWEMYDGERGRRKVF